MFKKNYYDNEVIEFKTAVNEYIAGKIDAPTVKHTTAKFGVYRQNNNSFMVRVRITGGNILLKQIKILAQIARNHKCNFFHLSTRQTVQIQGIPVTSLNAVVDQMVESGLFFRGGGGNTYRNIACSPETTFASDRVFDVLPYVTQVQNFVFNYDKAYTLPRKFKVSISCSDKDSSMATMQDLGFIATIKDNKKGFKVYVGGGMGRDSKIAMKAIEFIPIDQLLNVVAATIELFSLHGIREKRHLARLRHLRTAIGDEAFLLLFREFVAKTQVDTKVKIEHHASSPFSLNESSILQNSRNYKLWLKRAVTENIFFKNESTVDLFLPFGNLYPKEFIKLSELLISAGVSNLVLTAQQNLLYQE